MSQIFNAHAYIADLEQRFVNSLSLNDVKEIVQLRTCERNQYNSLVELEDIEFMLREYADESGPLSDENRRFIDGIVVQAELARAKMQEITAIIDEFVLGVVDQTIERMQSMSV